MNDPDDITAWQRIDARTTTSGKLVEAEIAKLAAIGVRHVINLAMDDHADALAGEAALMAAAGLRYTHIPVPFDAPDDDHFEAFVTAFEDEPDEPVHVHCIANMRVSAFLYRYHRDHAAMDESEARAMMEVQWSPDTGDNPALKPWGQFIAPRA